MYILFYLFSFFWFIRTAKAILFWFYLWQLKEYHWGRFIDHFRTERGKSLFLNWLLIFKIFLLFYALSLALYPGLLKWQLYALWIIILGILYFLETIKIGLDLAQRKLKKPVLTKKTAILILSALVCQTLFLLILFQKIKIFYWFAFGLLFFDILTPLTASGIVLSFQPLTIFLRNQIIQKAKRKREGLKNLLVIGITGSYGKTSTKEFLATILSEKFKVLKTKEHQNSEIGISQCILEELKPEYQIFVVEMGAYNRGGIKLLSDIVKPKIGILTGINEQHLATFGSLENIIKTKYELIESLPSDGIAFFNAKNKYCRELYDKINIKKFLYGKEAKTFGEENLLGAMAVAKELGMSDEEITKAVEKIENKFPGIQQKKGIEGLIIFDATYSANPDGVIGHLEHLKTFSGKKMIVMPCLIELGKASKEVHRRIGKKIAEVCDLAIITTKDRFKEIKEGARGKMAVSILFVEDPKEIFERIKSFCQAGDVVLLEGRLPEKLIKQLLESLIMNPLKLISISLSPNTEKDDILLALRLLFCPWRWKKLTEARPPSAELEEEFKKYLGVKYAISFNSGRSAFLAILKSLDLKSNDEVLLQAFTCNAAVNPIIWAGLKPVYVDCDEKTFNIDVEDLKRKITARSRVVMVQHTFGLPADLDEILKICQKNNLILIEDCAHSLGAQYKGEKVGTFGHASFFSFSRDKAISSVYGGMATTNDDDLAEKLKKYQKEVGPPSSFWIFQQLLHPVLMNWLILPTYKILGKYLLILFQRLQILSKAVHWKEKRGKKPGYFPKRLPNALAILALNQFKKLENFNKHRQKIANFYYSELRGTSFILPQNFENGKQIFLRFTIKHPQAHQIIKQAWQKNLLIGDWYDSIIGPADTKLDKMGYIKGSCPTAEKLTKETFNLPTHINISKKEAQKIVNFLLKQS